MYLLLIVVIIVRTLTDICFKMAVNNLHFNSVSSSVTSFVSLTKNIFLWLGLIFGLTNLIVWWLSLKYFDLSYAYPFLSISYITIIISGKVLFKEHLGKYKMAGILFISAGAVMLFLG
jgi:drug/metabolite transporter (DMT)-like permease